MKNQAIRLVYLALILAGFAGAAYAQTATGEIDGTVTDPKGLAVQGANMVITNTDTGIATPIITNETGRYEASLLQPGHYEVDATKSGFATVQTKDIDLQVGQILTVNFQLQIASQQGTVTVTATTPIVETEKTEQSQNVSEGLVSDLPIADRRWESFVLLTPAVTTDGTSGLTSFRGISSLYNNNSVDGANNSQAFFSEARGRAIIVAYVYSADSIKEFQVSASDYSAEYGQAAGGVVNAVTKSGTNQLHGDLFYNLRYPTLNALDPVAKESAANTGGVATQTVHQQNQFGGSVGTPIIKDKLFFFGTYDGFRKVNPIDYTTSAAATSTTTTIPNLTCPSITFITAAQCTAAKSFILTDLLGPFARTLDQDVYFAKLDYQLNQANHLDALYNFQDWAEPNGYNTSATVNNAGVTENGHGATHERFFIANWNTTVSSNKLNEFRFQWGQDYEFDTANAPGPLVSLTNLFGYGETSALPRPAFPDEHRLQFSDNFTIVDGNHTFKFGVDLNFIHEYLVNLFQGDGNYSYSGSGVAVPGAGCLNTTQDILFCDWILDVYGANIGDGKTGKHYASFTQVTDLLHTTNPGLDDFYDDDYSSYVQDSWKIRKNVLLNIGVRYDLQHIPQPQLPNTQNGLTAQFTTGLHIDTGDIAPRIGVAWQIANNTVLRLGYGIFYGKTSNSTYYALRVENGVIQVGYTCTATSTCAPTFPNVFFTPPGPALAAPFAGALTPQVVLPTLTGASALAHGMDPNFVNPRADEGEATFERQIPGGIALTASYLLTRGLHLPASFDGNLAPATTTKTYDVVNSAGVTQFMTTVPFYTARILPTYGTILNQYSIINSWYNAMVITARKPTRQGLELLANYTLSRSMDDGQTAGSNGTFFGTDGIFNPYNLKGEYAHSDLDQRNRFVGSVVWTPPYARSLTNKAERMLADGWSVSAIVTAASGQPYSALITNSSPVTGGVDGGETGGAVGTGGTPVGSRVSWMPRNSYNLPAWTNTDFRLSRSFSYRERYHLEVHADTFNLFNSTIIQAVNTSAYSITSTPSGATGSCPATGAAAHTNACIVPAAGFRTPTTTSGSLYGARQLQIGARFEF